QIWAESCDKPIDQQHQYVGRCKELRKPASIASRTGTGASSTRALIMAWRSGSGLLPPSPSAADIESTSDVVNWAGVRFATTDTSSPTTCTGPSARAAATDSRRTAGNSPALDATAAVTVRWTERGRSP